MSNLSNNEVQKQIRQMTSFIDQEANEKVEEIDAKAEEEFQIEKSRLVQEHRIKIMEYFNKKEKQIELSRKIQNSNVQNEARLKILKAKEEHLKNLKDEAQRQLASISKDGSRYGGMLQGLICQGLYHLLETKVIIKCRQCDVDAVRSVIPSCTDQYKKATGKEVSIIVDDKHFLPSNSAGGVEVMNQTGKIRVVNTLETRLEQIYEQMVPELREQLFGKNLNRKFRD